VFVACKVLVDAPKRGVVATMLLWRHCHIARAEAALAMWGNRVGELLAEREE
jgi:hypothetical protein